MQGSRWAGTLGLPGACFGQVTGLPTQEGPPPSGGSQAGGVFAATPAWVGGGPSRLKAAAVRQDPVCMTNSQNLKFPSLKT